MARVSLDDETVKWSDFEQPHRNGDARLFSDRRIVVWRYEDFGPFVFEKNRYVAELAKPGLTSAEEPRI